MKKALLGLAVALGLLMAAMPSIASATTDGPSGYMEICKYSTGLTGTPSFQFTVSGMSGTITVPNNSCTLPFRAPAGNDTVTEVPGSWYTVVKITTSPGSALISSNPQGSGGLNSGPNGTALVSVAPSSDISTATIVNFTNNPVYGYVEVCKNNASDAGLTGSWSFGITGNNAFSTTVNVPIGQCSGPVQVPAGSVTITETPGTSTSVSNIKVLNGGPSSTNTSMGTATVTVAPQPAAGDTSRQAIVTFFNETVQLKICKRTSSSSIVGPFLFTAKGTGDPSYPGGITEMVSVMPGQCQVVPGPYTNPNGTTGWRAGTQVAISEAPYPGTAVGAIFVAPSNRAVPGTTMLSPLPNPTAPGPAGSQSVVLGSGETDVAFRNDLAPDGYLKVCETTAHGVAAGTPFMFTATSSTPAGSTASLKVLAGSCAMVVNPVTLDGGWLYNSTVTITQSPGSSAIVPPIVVDPAARMISQNATSVTLTIGSGDTTEADFSNGGALSSSKPPTSSGSGTTHTSTSGTTHTSAPTFIASARMALRRHRRYLVVDVRSARKMQMIKVLEYNTRGKLIKVIRRRVMTNRSRWLFVGKRVRYVHVLLG